VPCWEVQMQKISLRDAENLLWVVQEEIQDFDIEESTLDTKGKTSVLKVVYTLKEGSTHE